MLNKKLSRENYFPFSTQSLEKKWNPKDMQTILALVSVCRLHLSLYSEANCIFLLFVFSFEMQCGSHKAIWLRNIGCFFFFLCFFLEPIILPVKSHCYTNHYYSSLDILDQFCYCSKSSTQLYWSPRCCNYGWFTWIVIWFFLFKIFSSWFVNNAWQSVFGDFKFSHIN